MGEPHLSLSESPFPSIHDENCFLDTYLATPAIWVPGMSDEEWQDACARMVRRSVAAHNFVSGQLSIDDFAETLFENGYDPHSTFTLWDDGYTLG